MKKALLSLSAFLLASSAIASSAPQLMPFSYRLKVPADAGLTCEVHAAHVASAFAAGARAKSVSGACQGRQTVVENGTAYAVDVIVVSYLSEVEQHPDKSVFGANAWMDNGDASSGVFATYAECLGQLAPQTSMFAAETGLTPVTAYCSAATNEMYPGYSLSIESFGERKHRLYTYSEDSVSYGEDASTIINAAVAAIKLAGGHVTYSNATRAFYYADARIPVAVENLGFFSVPQQCESQKVAAGVIFAKAGLDGVSSFCRVAEAAPGVTFATLFVVAVGGDEVQNSTEARYDSFEECQGDLGRVLQNAKSNGRNVYGGLCSPSETVDKGFAAHVFFGYN